MLIIVQLDTCLSSKIAFVGHSSSPVKAVATALPSPDWAKNEKKQKTKETVSLYSFNYKPFKSGD